MGAIKDLNKYLNRWLKDRGFDCTVRYSSDFSYDTINNIIDYSFIVPKDHDKLFFEICQSIRPEIEKCDNFILSFFHELGHFVTEDDIEQTDYDDYMDMEEEMQSKESFTNDDYLRYYTHQVEWEATVWACDYIVDHQEEIAVWFTTVQDFEKQYINELELESVPNE